MIDNNDKWTESQKIYLRKLINERKGIRTFKSKEEENAVMIKEAVDFLNNIYESNEYKMEEEFKYPFKYTEKDIQDIKDFFENANDEWILVDNSPVFKKHMDWINYAMEHNTRTLPTKKYYYKKKM
jgi:hypothetical protein